MKKSLFVVGLVSLLVLTGCSTNNNSESKTSNSDTEKVSKTDSAKGYQKLGDKDKKNVKFKVTKDNDKDDQDNELSLTINNKTKKDIKFNLAKFSLMSGSDKKASSEKEGTLTVKAGQKKIIDELFEDVSNDVLNGGNLSIQYLNSDNIVAQVDLGEKAATSQPDTDANTSTDTSNQNNTTANTNNDQNANTDQSSNTDNSATQADSNAIVKRADQADDLYRRSNGDFSAGLNWTKVDGGWQGTGEDGGSAFVSDSGDVTAHGNTTTYSTIVNAAQNGGPVKP